MPAGLNQHPLARAARCPRCVGAAPRRDCPDCGGVGLLLGDRVERRAPASITGTPREVFALAAVAAYALASSALTAGA